MSENMLAAQTSLDGLWEIEYDGNTATIQVPGAWDLQGFMDVVGPVCYKREVDIPAEWAGRRIMLDCGAVSYYTEIWLNGQLLGTHEGMWTPFSIDLTPMVNFDQPNKLELRVTKPGYDGDAYPYREVLVGFIPYVALTFGGVWQSIRLSAHEAPAWDSIQLEPDWHSGTVKISAKLSNPQAGLRATATITDYSGTQVAVIAYELESHSTETSFFVTIEEHRSWSPADPYLYQLRLTLEQSGQIITEATRQFGFRELSAQGETLLLNGVPIHLRGVLGWGWNPDTLAPIFTDDEIRAEFKRIREHGFNLLKLCLFVPPPRFYEIADEEGMLLWLELPMWLPRLNDHLRQQAHVEYQDILMRDHHHASIVLYSLGCELGADMADAKLLEDLDTLVRGAVTGALVCDNSGSGEAYKGLAFDFADFNDYHFYSDLHYFNPLLNHFQRDWRPARPWIFGEFCDQDDFRAADVLLEQGERPWWREVFGIEGNITRWAYPEQESRMAAHNLPFSDEHISTISRQESLLFRKFILEQTRLRRFVGGYVVTGLRDTPISTSGIFDDHNQPKYDSGTFRAFNADNVLVLEGGRTRVWQHGGDRPSPIDQFNHLAGSEVDLRIVLAQTGLEMNETELTWELFPQGASTPFVSGREIVNISDTSPTEIARIALTVPEISNAQEWRLQVSLEGICENQWSVWFYPVQTDLLRDVTIYDPSGGFAVNAAVFAPQSDYVLLTTVFTEQVRKWVAAGGRAILLAEQGGGLPVSGVPFWRESIKLLYKHPLLAEFPHQGYADLQFYHLATDHALDTAQLTAVIPELKQITPIIQRLDARLFTLSDYLIELKIGSGTLLASTLHFNGGAGDQVNGLDSNPAGQFLLGKMVDYLQR